MAFTDFETAAHLATLERVFWSRRRPPAHIRDQLREGQRIAGHSIELFFVRPRYDDPTRTVEESVAKLTFVRTTGIWRLYWKRGDGKWHSYEPSPHSGSLEKALEVIHEDRFGCFFG